MEESTHHHLSATSYTDWIPVIFICMIGFGYFSSYVFLLYRGKKWRSWQLASFVAGILLLTVAMLPSMMAWGHLDMRGHMVQHLLMAMYAPIFLVLGAPMTLILKILPPKSSRRFFSFLRSSFFRFAAHPVTAFLLNIGGMFVLYLTPLYNLSSQHPVLHHLMHLHFFAAGYLFTWSIIGPDPAPNRPSFYLRLAVVFVSIAAHSFLSKLMYASLLPENSLHNKIQIQEGAKLMYYWGDLSEILLIIILFTYWYYGRSRTRQSLSSALQLKQS